MTLKNFIKKLRKINVKYGSNLKVVLADNILVVNPVFSKNHPKYKNVVVITDGL